MHLKSVFYKYLFLYYEIPLQHSDQMHLLYHLLVILQLKV